MSPNAHAWTVVFALSLPAAAGAQDADPDSMPTRREFVDTPLEVPHDPFGWGMKSTALAVGAKAAVVFDSNVFLAERSEDADLITVLLLWGELLHKRDENEFRVAYFGRERLYLDNSDLNGMEHFVDASGLVRISDFRLGAGVEFRERKDSFNPLEIPEPVDSRFLRGYVRAGTEFNRLDLTATADVSRFTIDDSFHDRGDYQRVGFSLMGTVRAWPQAEAFGELLLRNTEYDEDVFSDFSYLRVAVGARTALAPSVRGEGRIGFGRTRIEDEGAIVPEDFSGIVVEAIAAWDVDPKHLLFAAVDYGPSESAVTGLGLHQGVRAGWRFRIDEHFTVRSSVRWGRESDAEGDFERTGVEGRVGARWNSGGNLFADAGLLFRQAQADDSALEYEDLRISFGMGVEW